MEIRKAVRKTKMLGCRRSLHADGALHKISRLKMLPTLGVPTGACCSMPSDSHSNGHSTLLRQRQQSRTSSLCPLPRAQGPCRWKARFAPAPPALARVHRALTCQDGARAAKGGKEEGVRVCPRDERRPTQFVLGSSLLALGGATRGADPGSCWREHRAAHSPGHAC